MTKYIVIAEGAIEKPKQLATELAWRAHHLRALAVEELEKEIASGNDKGPLKKLFDILNAALATLTVEKFADAYAQTITYGMFAARWISSSESPLFTRKNLKDLLPETSAFLKDLFDKLVNSNFDKNLSWLLDDITSLLARTSVAQVFQDEKRDPSIHFYEDFLDAYDPQVRKDQGVYYTPDEVVSYIVRTAHASLQNDFGLPLGLADTTTWAALAKAKKLAVPDGVDPKAPFVQVLDPALGTGTFLLRVIEVIHETMQTEFKKQGLDEQVARKAWVSYVRKDLLPRINGFELMMAPYIVSHLRLGLALQETGFTFTKNDRLRVFLTNSLEPHTAAQLSFIGEHVAEEAKEAERAKKSIRVTVVVGNPPYAGHSQNNGEWARGLVEPYRSIDGKALRLAQGKWLQNDYVKFIAYAERRIASTGFGVLGFITDHSYLDGDTFPGLRHHLLATFSNVDVLNLHGNLARREAPPDGGADGNVFNIMQGVAILCARRTPDTAEGLATFRTADLWGARGPKLQRLHAAAEGVVPIAWLTDLQHDERFLFIATGSGTDASVEFAQFDAIDAVFSPNGRPAPGFLTTHDDFAIAFTRHEISDHVTTLLATKSEADARDQFKLCTQSQWQYADAKKVLATGAWRKQLVSCLYRPFDERWTVYDPSVLVHRRERVNAHLLEPGNVALLTTRMTKGDDFSHVFLSDKITEVISLSSKTSANAFVFPLFLRDPDGLVKRNQPNIDRQVSGAYTEIAGKAATPMAMFEYWYAVLSSPSYRRRYNELLIREFPRVPRPSSAEVFKALGEHGKRLIELHLLKTSPKSLGANDGLLGKGDGVVAPGMPKFDAKEGKIWINTKQWFAGASTAVWGFKIGSYEVCKKWLSARRGRSLSSDESRRFASVLNALRETIEEQGKIDRTIESYGGWPAAFRLVGGAVATVSVSTEEDDE
jgi:predicted helicase